MINQSDYRSSRIVILSGFILVLMLMGAVTFLASFSISSNTESILEIVEEQSEVSDVFAMRDAAYKRTILLYRMLMVADPFEQDEFYLQFKEQAEVFIKARDSLLSKIYNSEELNGWDTTKNHIREGVSAQTQVVTNIQEGNKDEANNILLTQALPVQDKVMLGLTKMMESQNRLIYSELNVAQNNNKTFFLAILIMGIAAVTVGGMVTVYVSKHNNQTEKLLLQQTRLAESANHAKSNFLANMSHEIRTPLTAIIGFAESLMNENFSREEQQRINQTIIRNGKHLQQVINDVLDLSKIEAGQLEIERIKISPIQIIYEVESIVGMRARDKGLDFNIKYNFPIPKTIFSDPTRLKQILINLCGNATKFTDEGSIVINVDYLANKQLLEIKVCDSGIGMSAEELAHVFNPFSQADSSTTRKYGGTGLGLSISKQLAEKLGGSLICESEKGVGSTFILQIASGEVRQEELVNGLDEHKEVTDDVSNTVEIKSLRGNILLAEDSPDNQSLISMYVKKTGANLTIVENGQLAVEAALVSDFDLILMDMQMPVMDGVEAITMLRDTGYTGPIVSLTANAMKTDRDKCFSAGANDFLVKPIDVTRFYKVLNTYLPENNGQQKTFAENDFRNDPEFVELLEMFYARLPQLINELKTAIHEQDCDKTLKVSHDIKGMGGAFGYPDITDVAAEIYSQAKQKNNDNVTTLFKQLCALHDAINQQRKVS